MNLLLCHTPLHILIGLLMMQQTPQEEMFFVLIEDVHGLHAFARSVLSTSHAQLLLLPGAAHGKDSLRRAFIQRSNARILRKRFGKTAKTVFIFHDLRAESQALLNLPDDGDCNIHFVLLEDGIALYEPHGLLVGGLVSVLKRKIFFDTRWRHAREIGLHPKLKEIRCFYPQLLRRNLRHLEASALPIAMPNALAGKIATIPAIDDGQFAAIAIPHASSVAKDHFFDFLKLSLDYCKRNHIAPLLKFHPSDRVGPEIVKKHSPSSPEVPQWMPLELFLFSHPQVSTFIGTRTSTLHISKAICPDVDCIYYDQSHSREGQEWIDFLDAVGVSRLS